MALTSTRISSASTTPLFVATGDQAITTIIFCNTDEGSEATIDVYAVADGDVVGASTTILRKLLLPPTETFVMDAEKLILANGDAIWAQASVNLIVTATVSSVSI